MAERGVDVDHATLNRWVVRYSPQIAAQAQKRKKPTASSWRVDETYIKVKGKWTYLYRARGIAVAISNVVVKRSAMWPGYPVCHG